MFRVKCYNEATGKTETVSDRLSDIVYGNEDVNRHRRVIVDEFAAADTQTDHVYYAETVE